MDAQSEHPERKQTGFVPMRPTTSTAIAAYSHDPVRQELNIKFKNGGCYVVRNFTVSDFLTFDNSPSLGGYYQSVIRKNPERWPAAKVPLAVGAWDGEERRVMPEPLSIVERTAHRRACGIIRLGDGEEVAVNATEYTVQQEDRMLDRLVACANACAGLPTERLQDVINAGLMSLGRMDRRGALNIFEGEEIGPVAKPTIPDEFSEEAEAALRKALDFGGSKSSLEDAFRAAVEAAGSEANRG